MRLNQAFCLCVSKSITKQGLHDPSESNFEGIHLPCDSSMFSEVLLNRGVVEWTDRNLPQLDKAPFFYVCHFFICFNNALRLTLIHELEFW